MPTPKIVNTTPITKGNAFFGTGSSSKSHPVKPPKLRVTRNKFQIEYRRAHSNDPFRLVPGQQSIFTELQAVRDFNGYIDSPLRQHSQKEFQLVHIESQKTLRVRFHKSVK